MSTMTLEPCPFCGSTDVEAYPADRERSRWNVCCGNPGCVTRGDNDYLLQADAVAAWNRRAHLAQPAQAVDVGMVREVIDILQADGAPFGLKPLADKLTRAISGEKAGQVDGEVLVAIERGEGYEDVHPELVAEDCMGNAADRGWRYRVLTASPAPDKEG